LCAKCCKYDGIRVKVHYNLAAEFLILIPKRTSSAKSVGHWVTQFKEAGRPHTDIRKD
jgi:hypothetical protein